MWCLMYIKKNIQDFFFCFPLIIRPQPDLQDGANKYRFVMYSSSQDLVIFFVKGVFGRFAATPNYSHTLEYGDDRCECKGKIGLLIMQMCPEVDPIFVPDTGTRIKRYRLHRWSGNLFV